MYLHSFLAPEVRRCPYDYTMQDQPHCARRLAKNPMLVSSAEKTVSYIALPGALEEEADDEDLQGTHGDN